MNLHTKTPYIYSIVVKDFHEYTFPCTNIINFETVTTNFFHE